jgi:hypothetical protein
MMYHYFHLALLSKELKKDDSVADRVFQKLNDNLGKLSKSNLKTWEIYKKIYECWRDPKKKLSVNWIDKKIYDMEFYQFSNDLYYVGKYFDLVGNKTAAIKYYSLSAGNPESHQKFNSTLSLKELGKYNISRGRVKVLFEKHYCKIKGRLYAILYNDIHDLENNSKFIESLDKRIRKYKFKNYTSRYMILQRYHKKYEEAVKEILDSNQKHSWFPYIHLLINAKLSENTDLLNKVFKMAPDGSVRLKLLLKEFKNRWLFKNEINIQSLEVICGQSSLSIMPIYAYFCGKFLEIEGMEEEAVFFYSMAAQSRYNTKYNYMLSIIQCH